MNIEQLKTFQEVVKLGSFSEVAKKLGISQPAVSFQIQKLEQELGVRLIDRGQRSFNLTAAGKRFLQFAESVDGQHQRLAQDLENMREAISGDLVIAASTIPGEFLLPPLLAKFKRQYPAVKIQVDISDSLAVINGIITTTYEVGFSGLAPEGRNLASFKIAGDEIMLIVPPEHPFAARGEVTPEELTGEPLIFREPASGTRRSLENYLGRAGFDLKSFRPHLVLGSTLAVVSAVAAGAGIGFVSSLAVANRLANVSVVKVQGWKLARDFFCVYRQERIVSRLLEVFISFIKMETGKEGGG